MDDRRVLWPRNRHHNACMRDTEGSVSVISLLLVVFDVMVDRWPVGLCALAVGRTPVQSRVDRVSD